MEKNIKKAIIIGNIGLGRTCTNTMLGEVRCPNLCFNGLEKVHDIYKALYDFCKCKYCNGRGFVKSEDYEQINSKI